MEVVYFFYGSALVPDSDFGFRRQVRVPFHSRDRRLYDYFIAHNGLWDHARREFVFSCKVAVEEIIRKFPALICVWVDENFPGPLRIFGFYDRFREKALDVYTIINEEMNADRHKNYNEEMGKNHHFNIMQPPLPEKFTDHWQIKLETALLSRKYSPRTVSIYIYFNRLLCNLMRKAPEDICPDDVTQFLALVERDKDYSASSMNLAISAIKFFYREILKKYDICDQHRPRHDKRLPMVLSKDEIAEVLRKERNPKHRLLLMLVYSSGLRVSEVVALKKEHVDFARKTIYIVQGKGRKDRCTLLSEKAAVFIAEYCSFFNIKGWLFPGQPVTNHLTIRSAQHIFDKAIRRAAIEKKITIHGLRHTFATHLLESGTDIRYIQTLLGHSNLRTTERYTHIARRSILNIKSPLDTMP